MLCQLRSAQESVNLIIMISKHSSASDKLRKRRTYPRDEFGSRGLQGQGRNTMGEHVCGHATTHRFYVMARPRNEETKRCLYAIISQKERMSYLRRLHVSIQSGFKVIVFSFSIVRCI